MNITRINPGSLNPKLKHLHPATLWSALRRQIRPRALNLKGFLEGSSLNWGPLCRTILGAEKGTLILENYPRRVVLELRKPQKAQSTNIVECRVSKLGILILICERFPPQKKNST